MTRTAALVLALGWSAGCLDAGTSPLAGERAPYVRNTSPDMGLLIRKGDYLEGTGNDVIAPGQQIVVTFSKAMDPTPSLLATGIVVCCRAGTSTNVSLVQPAPQPGPLQETPETGDVPFTVITSANPSLSVNTQYTLMVKPVLRDVSGTRLRDEVRVPFTTTR
jgi:hypothetical protein